jgi:hypothetical protein
MKLLIFLIFLCLINIEYDIWLTIIYNYSNYNKKYIEKFQNSEQVSIILTTTISINSKINLVHLKDTETRKDIYIYSIKKWLSDTKFNIIIVENSGYLYPELDNEKEKYKDRFEIISFNGNELEEAKYLVNNSSKGAHEFFAIDYALKNSELIKKSKFIIKITGRYYIPDLEDYINSLNIFEYYALHQYIQFYCPKCEIVGCRSDYANYIFDKEIKFNNDIVEYEWNHRMNKLDSNKVLTLPLFKIEPTRQGGIPKINYYL